MKFFNFTKTGSLLLLFVMLTGCSKALVSNAKVSSHTKEGEVFVDFEAQVLLNSKVLTGTIPIQNPRMPGSTLGYLSLRPDLQGRSFLELSVSATQLLNLNQKFAPLLPNGEKLPISGTDVAGLSIPVAGGHRIYVLMNLNKREFILGAAVALPFIKPNVIKEPGSLFVPFNFNSLTGLAGIFLGPHSGQSGLALFVDASSLYKTHAFQRTHMLNMSATETPQPSTWQWAPPETSWETRQTIDHILSELQKTPSDQEIVPIESL